jgi:hypothetical protein
MLKIVFIFIYFRLRFHPEQNSVTYTCEDLSETIRYHTEDKFYRVTMYPSGSAIFQMGDYGKVKVEDMLNGMMQFAVPKFDISCIKSTDQLMSKMKIYNLFS